MTQSLGRLIPVDILTTNHYIFGQLRVTNTGLMGILSDTTSSYLEVSEASLTRIVKPDKVINYAPVIWLVKDQTVAVCLNKVDFLGAQTLAKGGYLRVVPYGVQITTPIYEVQGTVEWAGRFEFSSLVSEGTNDFIPVLEARLEASLFPALHFDRPVILLNRRFIDTLSLEKKAGQSSHLE